MSEFWKQRPWLRPASGNVKSFASLTHKSNYSGIPKIFLLIYFASLAILCACSPRLLIKQPQA